jgi:hypothetical protein
MPDPLTERERLFVHHLALGRPGIVGNMTRAAMAAGASSTNERAASVWAYLPHISRGIW